MLDIEGKTIEEVSALVKANRALPRNNPDVVEQINKILEDNNHIINNCGNIIGLGPEYRQPDLRHSGFIGSN